MRRIYLLSPAKVGGIRARLLLNPRASFALARQLRAEGLPLADIFSFASALYFRGKITYAVGRGDMSRGGLILRSAREGKELPYTSVLGAVFKGKRAPRLADM